MKGIVLVAECDRVCDLPVVEASALLRRAVMANHADPLPQWLAGRDDNGAPLRHRHVTWCMADGSARVWLPAEAAGLSGFRDALEATQNVGRSKLGEWTVQPSLGSSRSWVSLTPSSPGNIAKNLRPNATAEARMGRIARRYQRVFSEQGLTVANLSIVPDMEPAKRKDDPNRRATNETFRLRVEFIEAASGVLFAGDNHFGLDWMVPDVAV